MKERTLHMKMIEVENSNIRAIGYQDKKRDLFIDFKSGSYVYHDVPRQVFDRMMTAPSKGKFVWSDIRGYYAYEKLKWGHYA